MNLLRCCGVLIQVHQQAREVEDCSVNAVPERRNKIPKQNTKSVSLKNLKKDDEKKTRGRRGEDEKKTRRRRGKYEEKTRRIRGEEEEKMRRRPVEDEEETRKRQ